MVGRHSRLRDATKAWIVRAEPKPPWDKCDRSIRRCPLPTKEEVFFISRYGEVGAKAEAEAQAKRWSKDPHIKTFYIIRYWKGQP